jgi:eukaryotic-like serine/threonine-protein kinase
MRLTQDLVGEILADRYRLVARVAGGGMGEVYRGRDLLLARPVAVKVLQPWLARDDDLVERFRDEACTAARLSHPNIVTVFDWGHTVEGTHYMVMEYLPGTDLRDLLVAHGALEPLQAAEIMASVCDALAAAHDHGLLHRDIKPENILLTDDGKVKVTDFGIATIAGLDRAGLEGTMPGTLRYLAPEQARGESGSAASDIWAAGAVLAELLTARPPLQGAGSRLLDKRARETPVRPSSIMRGVPPDLDEVVLRACALEPRDRYEDASYMAHALRRAGVRSLPEAPAVESLMGELTTEIDLTDSPRSPFSADVSRKRRAATGFVSLVRAVFWTALLVAGVLAVMKVLPMLFGPAVVEVPSLKGLPLEAALTEARDAGLRPVVIEKKRVLAWPKGQVITQDPGGGDAKEGSKVSLVVSAGPPLVAVPEVSGIKLGAAADEIKRSGLVVGEVSHRYVPVPVGVVVGTVPTGEKLEWGESVRLVVSRGPRPTKVPGLNGLSLDEAKEVLRKKDLAYEVHKSYSDDVADGEVMSTDPEEGAAVGPDEAVELVVSMGPQFEPVKLPDLRGTSSTDAQRRLKSLGLDVRTLETCTGGATVVDTDPIAGTTVLEGDLVSLLLC